MCIRDRYQGGGHDDSHGDYGFVGTQQGGVEDFNTLIDEGLKYGIKNGVHILSLIHIFFEVLLDKTLICGRRHFY